VNLVHVDGGGGGAEGFLHQIADDERRRLPHGKLTLCRHTHTAEINK
jgi:hypothetical protein